MNPPSPQQQVEFLNELQRLLADGQFVATYKFALLHALADICVEKGADIDASFPVSTNWIAEKFIQYYWRQIRPFTPHGGDLVLLRQNTGKTPAVIRELNALHASGLRSLAELQAQTKRWNTSVRRVRETICEMPLGKLQTIGKASQPFLYDDTAAKSGRILETIELKPGVMFCLRKFHPLITDLVRGAWVRYVRRYNADTLGAPADLDEFLFGSERASLAVYVPILRELQDSRCFYCGGEVSDKQAHVDHFIPWGRYPIDLGHNFVLAHAACNSAKSDHLAAVVHLEKWITRNSKLADALRSAFQQAHIFHDQGSSLRIAEWNYRALGERSQTWIRRTQFEELPPTWESLFAA